MVAGQLKEGYKGADDKCTHDSAPNKILIKGVLKYVPIMTIKALQRWRTQQKISSIRDTSLGLHEVTAAMRKG